MTPRFCASLTACLVIVAVAAIVSHHPVSASPAEPEPEVSGSPSGKIRKTRYPAPRPAVPRRTASARGGSAAFETAFLSANDEPEGDMPRDLAYLPDGSACAIANRDTDTVTFFDVATATITDTVTTGSFPVDVAVAPDGSVAVTANLFGDSVTVIDVATGEIEGFLVEF